MKQITKKIFGHYRSHTCTIVRVDMHEWHLQMASGRPYRIGGLVDNQTGIGFVDPSGGPFIAVGTPLREYAKGLPDTKIKAIVRKDNEYFLLTEPKKRIKKNL